MSGPGFRSFQSEIQSRASRAAIVGRLPAGPGPYVIAASTLEGNRVVNYQDEDLGTIKAIMLDVQNGQVAYAVLAFGGVLGVRAKLFAVPWGALALDTDRECFILDADREALKEAPGFDKDHWPTMADPGWAMQVYSLYKVPLTRDSSEPH